MDEPEEIHAREAKMSYEEIIKRFKKLFGRDMTPAERKAFFLDILDQEES
jgi:hypothetical protein